MKPKHIVQWTKTAEQDLGDILEYISTSNPLVTAELFEQFRKKAADLESFPERCRIVPELKENGILNYREMIVERWRIIYKISAQTVYVLAVLDSRRNLEDILLDRFLLR